MEIYFRTWSVPGLIVFLCCASCAATLGRADDAAEKQDYLKGGYFLLHQLCGNEAQLPLLLDLKTAPADIKTFADKISRTAKETNSILDKMQANDPALKFDRNPLPAVERDVRASIQDEKQHQLLFGTKNAEFSRALLVSQIEATNYALNLAKVLAGRESDHQLIKTLQQVSAKWNALNQESTRLLSSVR